MKALASRPFCPCKGRPGKLVVISRTVQGHDPLLSLGYDMTQPLLAGIVTALGGKQRGGQAMGFNVFTLFTGFGFGSLLFGEALRLGFVSGQKATLLTTAIEIRAQRVLREVLFPH